MPDEIPVRDADATADAAALNQQASVLMKRGIACLEAGTAAAWTEAIPFFDRAIEIRRALPLDRNPMFRYGLAAGWMNRADALTRLGGAEHLDAAMAAYDEAIGVLGALNIDASPLFRRRLAMAWQNRGLTAERRASPAEAARSFDAAIAALSTEAADAIDDREVILAVAWTNRARLYAAADETAHARRGARTAISLVRDREHADELAAEAGLTARHVLCQALAQAIEAHEGEAPPDELNEATDAVDDGMALARHWERQGVERFRPLAFDLFRFGVRVYHAHQPHFLNEFVLENVDPDASSGAFVGSPEMRAATLESLWLSLRAPRAGDRRQE
jgi:tetratricopeptide (TPR) repeat protein